MAANDNAYPVTDWLMFAACADAGYVSSAEYYNRLSLERGQLVGVQREMCGPACRDISDHRGPARMVHPTIEEA